MQEKYGGGPDIWRENPHHKYCGDQLRDANGVSWKHEGNNPKDKNKGIAMEAPNRCAKK